MDPNLEQESPESAIAKLTKDLRDAAVTLKPREVRYLVDSYYQMQKNRIRSAHQVRSLAEYGEPHAAVGWLEHNASVLESQVLRTLNVYSNSHPMGRWARSIVGIGPVLSSALLGYIDITKAPTVGHIWRFAGLDPTVKWNKGEKRPWNGQLKTLCWKIAKSFVFFCNHPKAYYGPIYIQRRAYEDPKNAAGDYKEQAAEHALHVDKKTIAWKSYSKGLLPDGHMNNRAMRYTVKLFLSHWHHQAYLLHYGHPPPAPYPIGILGHGHFDPGPPPLPEQPKE